MKVLFENYVHLLADARIMNAYVETLGQCFQQKLVNFADNKEDKELDKLILDISAKLRTKSHTLYTYLKYRVHKSASN